MTWIVHSSDGKHYVPDEDTLRTTRPEVSASGAPATARLSVKAFPMGAPISFAFWVQLNVGYGGAHMTYSE